jgi:2-polyprenyl-3-methyl-5-hydroxy-6-metoxy-1,4-benzoquinol methylase
MPGITSSLGRALDRRLPAGLSKRMINLSPAALGEIETALREDYFPTFSTWRSDYLTSEEGRSDLQDQLTNRMEGDRRYIVPWINAAMKLDGAEILELGAGTGSSTAAFAEQGAKVTAVDVNCRHLRVAERRCDALGLKAEFVCANAKQVHEQMAGRQFDLVVFFATLEHMTSEERLEGIGSTFTLVRPGGLWGIIESPNRLWYFDSHTSGLPFFMWLPDELAMQYRRFSARREFAEDDLEGVQGSADIGFARWGRGISFHEFDLALGPVDDLEVVSSLAGWLRGGNPLRSMADRLSRTGHFRRMLQAIAADRRIHPGFFEHYLNLLIRRPQKASV